MASIEPIDLSEARRAMVQSPRSAFGRRTLTSENMQNVLSGGSGYGGFNAGKIGRLTADWSASPRSADQDLLVDLRRMRARARQQAINSPLISKFLGMVRSNVIGVHGIKLAFKVPPARKTKNRQFDEETNAKLKTAWTTWQRREYCT